MENITNAETQEVLTEGTFEIKNFEDYKKTLTDTIANNYTLSMVNEDTYSLAKTMRADLNKLKDAIDTKRKKFEKLYMKPFNVGKAQYKELCTIIDEASKKLGEGINAMDDKFHEERKAKCVEYFSRYKDVYPVEFEQIFDSKWLNKSTKFDDVKEAIDAKMTAIAKDLIIIGSTIKDEETRVFAYWRYFKALNLEQALSEANAMVDEMATIKQYIAIGTL